MTDNAHDNDAGATRFEYAERVGRQSLQMLLIATRTQDRAMRDELHAFAERMSAHALWLCGAACSDMHAAPQPR